MTEKHEKLNNRRPLKKSREIVVKHLRKTVYSSYIKDLYEELTAYLKSIIYKSAVISKDRESAYRLLGEHSIQFTARDILQFNNLRDIIKIIAEDIVRKLENERSTMSLIRKICKKIGLEVPDEVVNSALPYLEMRHILVHADGKIDKEFKKKYPMFKSDSKNRINLNYDIIIEATESVTQLVLEIDKQAVNRGILKLNTP